MTATDRDEYVPLIAELLRMRRGQPDTVTAAAIYDAAIAPMLAGVDDAVTAIRDALKDHPDAHASVTSALAELGVYL